MNEYFEKHGYTFLDIEPIYHRDHENGTVNIEYLINDTKRVYVNNINIAGNFRTMDKVIRREIRLSEGDAYNTAKIDRSKKRIENLGYFKDVTFDAKRTDKSDKVDVDVAVQEQSSGSLNFGIGIGNEPAGRISFAEDNLAGTGRSINLFVQKSQHDLDYGIDYTEPYFLNRNMKLQFSVGKEESKKYHTRAFSYRGSHFMVKPIYEVNDNLDYFLYYKIENNNLYDVANDVAKHIADYKGKYNRSIVGHGFGYDNVDSLLNPSHGHKLEFMQSYAGIGGKAKYIEHSASATKFFPIKKDQIVLEVNGEAKHIKGIQKHKVHILSRYFMGGTDVRGFRSNGIGPRDKDTGDATGGELYYLLRSSLYVPTGLPDEYGMKAFVFTDMGNLSYVGKNYGSISDKHYLRVSSGIGLRFLTKFGKVEFSLGVPVNKTKLDKKKLLNFSFGSRF